MPTVMLLVTSTFPGDTSFEVGGIANFAQTSTYRAVLTRHASDADLNRTAPTMTTVACMLDYDSIGLTFSEACLRFAGNRMCCVNC